MTTQHALVVLREVSRQILTWREITPREGSMIGARLLLINLPEGATVEGELGLGFGVLITRTGEHFAVRVYKIPKGGMPVPHPALRYAHLKCWTDAEIVERIFALSHEVCGGSESSDATGVVFAALGELQCFSPRRLKQLTGIGITRIAVSQKRFEDDCRVRAVLECIRGVATEKGGKNVQSAW